MPGETSIRAAVLLLLGVFCCSTSVIFIKLSRVEPALLSAFRLLGAAFLLAPLFERARRQQVTPLRWRDLKRSVLPGVVLAAHFITWVIGARATLAANASLIVNMVPLAMPFALLLVAGERIGRFGRTELVSTAIGIIGVATLFAGDVSTGNAPGNLTCLVSMVLFAVYLAFARRNRSVASIWLYLVPLYAVAGLCCLALGAPRMGTLQELPAGEWLLVGGLTVIPTVCGHSLLNAAMKHFPGGVVSVCNVGQAVFAGVAAWLLFGEVPRGTFWPGALLIVVGIFIALRASIGARAGALASAAANGGGGVSHRASD